MLLSAAGFAVTNQRPSGQKNLKYRFVEFLQSGKAAGSIGVNGPLDLENQVSLFAAARWLEIMCSTNIRKNFPDLQMTQGLTLNR